MSKDADNDDGNLKEALFTVSDAVLGAAVLLAIGVYGGGWLDKQLHTAPWFSMGLALLGGGVGLARMVMKAQALGKSDPGMPSKTIVSSKDPLASPPADEESKSDEKISSPKPGQLQNKESSRFRLPHDGFTDE